MSCASRICASISGTNLSPCPRIFSSIIWRKAWRSTMRRKRPFDSSSIWSCGMRLAVLGAGKAREQFVGDAQALDRPSADEVLRHDLGHVGGRHVPVPDLFGIDHDRHALRALVEAAGLVRAHDALHAGLVQLLLEGLDDLLRAARRAAAALVGGIALVGADEDVALELRHARPGFYQPPAPNSSRARTSFWISLVPS